MTTAVLSGLAASLDERLRTRTARTGVVGLGYVGLPLLVEFARSGFHATGVDLDAAKVAAITRGESYIQDVPSSTVAPLSMRRATSAGITLASVVISAGTCRPSSALRSA